MPQDPDAELRAALVVSTLPGVAAGHQRLGLSPLRETPADRIAALLRPPSGHSRPRRAGRVSPGTASPSSPGPPRSPPART
nr:hypothetical protein [Streptomyces violaceorubidus]